MTILRSLKSVVVKVSAGLGMVLFIAFIGLQLQFNATRPTTMQPSAGRIYPLGVHGHTAYLTQRERRTLDTMEWSAGLFVLVAGVVGYFGVSRTR